MKKSWSKGLGEDYALRQRGEVKGQSGESRKKHLKGAAQCSDQPTPMEKCHDQPFTSGCISVVCVARNDVPACRRRASSRQRIRAQSQSRRNSFKCITDMTPVRHFYVDNLLGYVEATAAVAKAGKGDYPEGSVLQLMPNEVMIKQQKGFNSETHDWEFFYIDVDTNGSKIFARSFAEVNNRLGMNCFACHSQAKPEFDLVCEQDHGCAPIPVTRAMFGALQRTDPRCKGQKPVSPEDAQALKELDEVVKSLKANQ
jgi:hypothetical protein